MDLVKPQEIMKSYHYSTSTFYRRRSECLVSPYEDAIVLDGGRRTLVDKEKFEEFLQWRSDQKKKEYFGIL